MDNPQLAHLTATKKKLQYLKGTLLLRNLVVYPAEDASGLCVFTDADRAGEVNSQQSTSCIFVQVWSAPIAWSTRLPPTTEEGA